MTRRIGIGAAVLLAAALVAGAEPIPTPEDLSRQVEEIYAGLQSYEAVGAFIMEMGGITVRTGFRIWASYPRTRIEYDPLTAPGQAAVPMPTLITDAAAGRQFTQIREGVWVDEEIEQNWAELGMFPPDVPPDVSFATVREEDLHGRPMWVLAGTVQAIGWEVAVRVWVDQESLWIRKMRVEIPAMTMTFEVHDFRPGVEIPADVFLLPPGATVIVRAPRSPEAEAIMDRVWDKHAGLTSFSLLKTETRDGNETEVAVWYQDPILRQEHTSLVRGPLTGAIMRGPVSVTVSDLAGGVSYHFSDGRWSGSELPPFFTATEIRTLSVLALGFSLAPNTRYTSVEEDTVGDRPAWRITGEPESVHDEIRVLRWWVDRETYEVLQYEGPVIVSVHGERRTETRTVRIERFEPNAVVPPEKLDVPEGVPIRRFGEPPLPPAAVEGWERFSEDRLAEAQAQGKPVLLYFSARWCADSLKFEEGALADAQVVAATAPFVRLAVDLTAWGSPEASRLRLARGVREVPLLVILGPDGSEVRRVQGNVPASVLLDALRAAAPAP
jgi:outer membrane lipoprotein-sorting protein